MRGDMKESSDLNASDIVSTCEEWRKRGGTVAKPYAKSSRLDIWDRVSILAAGESQEKPLPASLREK